MDDELRCPGCGEDTELTGTTGDDGVITITCDTCGAGWRRDPTPRCPECGRTDLYGLPVAVVEKSRGTQLSITGTERRWSCWDCDAELIHAQRLSGRALMPKDLPTT